MENSKKETFATELALLNPNLIVRTPNVDHPDHVSIELPKGNPVGEFKLRGDGCEVTYQRSLEDPLTRQIEEAARRSGCSYGPRAAEEGGDKKDDQGDQKEPDANDPDKV